WEAAGPHGGDLEGIDPVAVLAPAGGAEGVGLPVQVEAGQLGQGRPVPVRSEDVEDGVGLGADHLDPVPEPGEFAREVAHVDALPAAERVSLVGEERDAERSQAVGCGALRRPGLTGLSGHSGPPSPCTVPRGYAGTLI